MNTKRKRKKKKDHRNRMAPIENYEENALPSLIFSIVMMVANLLTLPILILVEKGQDWFRKPERGRSTNRIATTEANEEGVVTDSEAELDLQGEEGFEVIEMISVGTQVNFCEDLFSDSNLNLVPEKKETGGSGVLPLAWSSLRDVDIVNEDDDKENECWDQVPSDISKMESELVKKVCMVESFYYRRPVNNKESMQSTMLITPERNRQTQTSDLDFSFSRDCVLIAEEDPCPEEKPRVVTGVAGRYQPSVSSNSIICPRVRPGLRGEVRDNCCACPGDRGAGGRVSIMRSTTRRNSTWWSWW